MSIRFGKGAVALAAALLLGAFFFENLRGAAAAGGDSQTSDEAVTITSGYAWLRTHRVLLNGEHPMLAKALIAAPLLWLRPTFEPDSDAWRSGQEWVAAYEFVWENRVPPGRILQAARLPVTIAATLLLLAVFLTACRLYGPGAGLTALLVGAACPDFLGHGHLATLDVPLALAAFVSLLLFLRYAARPSRGRHLLLGIALGCLCATKISGLQVLPALFFAAFVRCAIDPEAARRGSVRVPGWIDRSPRVATTYVLLGGLLSAMAIGALVVIATYLGSPQPYLEGLARNALLTGYGHPTYLDGEVRTTGFPSYFVTALGVKLPVLTLLMLAAGLVSLPWLRRGRDAAEATLLAFALGFFLLASFGPAQTGVRYLFPIYPVLFVYAGRITSAIARPALAAAFLLMLALGYAAVLAGARPEYLSYFNERVRTPERALGTLADSNLDWGQDLGRLAGWLAQRGNPPVRLSLFSNAPPEAWGIRFQALPAAGPVLPPRRELLPPGRPDLVCVSANNLLGLFFNRDSYGWLREREPLAVIGGSIWVYDLEGRPEDHLRLAQIYQDFGWNLWADHELRTAESLR